MDNLTAMMSMEDIPEEELRVLAKALAQRSSTGGRLSTSTIEPVATQGGRMQTEANSQALGIGLQNYRKEALKQRNRDSILRAASSSARGFHKPSNKATADFEHTASTINNVSGLLGRWNPEFVSSLPLSGPAEEWAGRTNLIPSTETQEAMGAWWSDWKAVYENIVRHDLFGSALTATEKAEWRKANINSNMDPEVIAAKMAKLSELNQKAAAYNARNAINKDWDPKYVRDIYEGTIPEKVWESPEALDAYVKSTREAYEAPSDLEERASTSGRSIQDLSDEEFMELVNGLQ